jgi:tetratricopeptide (TPR) repeat protein
MTPQQWEQVDQILLAAINLPVAQREPFIRASTSDESLQQEVLSLLSHEDQVDNFLETPAIETAALNLANMQQQDLSGTRLGHFEINKPIGAGGMGTVYLARDLNLHREVALKILPLHFALNPDRVKRFKREAQMLARVHHPNVATLFDFDREQENQPRFLVMDYISGITLAERFTQGKMPLAEAATIFSQLASGLNAAHKTQVIHRDLKPSNVKITPEGNVKILDFGLAKITERETVSEDSQTKLLGVTTSQGTITKDRVMMGTLTYMSPEQVCGDDITSATDWWSYGVMLFEALSGEHPFREKTDAETMAAILGRAPNWKLLPKETPATIRDFLALALRKKASERIVNATSIEAAFKKNSVRNILQNIKVAAATALILLGSLFGFNFFRSKFAPAIPAEKTLAVLGFTFQNSTSQDDQLTALGLTESLRRTLSNFSGLTIAESNDAVDAKWAVENLGANLILSGTIRKLTDAAEVEYTVKNANGEGVFSGVAKAENLQAAQQQIVSEVTAKLKGTLNSAAIKKSSQPIASYQSYLKALELLRDTNSLESVNNAIALLGQSGDAAEVQALQARAYLARFKLTNDKDSISSALNYSQAANLKNPDLAEVQQTLGEIHLANDNEPQAIAAFQRSIEKSPNNLEAFVGLASAYEYANQPAQAQATFQTAISKNPNFWLGYSEAGAFYYGQKNYEQALYYWLRLKQLLPRNVKNLNNLGSVLLKLQRYDQAKFHYEEALKIAPNANTYAGLGSVNYWNENFPQAVEAYQKSIELAPDNPQFYGNLGDALRMIDGRKSEAVSAYETAITKLKKVTSLDLESAETPLLMADWLSKIGGHEKEARQYFEQAMKREPEWDEVPITGVLIYHLLGQRQQSLQCFRQALALGVSSDEILSLPDLKELRSDQEIKRIASERKAK